jgi:hypothetical protein
MRRCYTLVWACLAGMAIFGASDAAAANTWLIAGIAVTAPTSIDSEFTLAFEDMGTAVKVECSGTGEGTVSTGGKDTQTTVTENLASCKILAGEGTCKKLIAIKALDLPWNTQIAGERDNVTEGGAGAPGWLIECEGLFGIKVDDSCTLANGSTLLINKESGILESEAEAASGEGNCSVGGEKTWLLTGKIALLTLGGFSLAFS